jgi:hypothetical protein
MTPNGPPAKLVALNATQANAANNTRKMFDMTNPPQPSEEQCYHGLCTETARDAAIYQEH